MLGVYSRLSIKPGENVLDAGAGIGDFSILTALANPYSTVVALEPDPSYFRILLQNVKRNNVGNRIPMCVALSDATGTDTIGFGDTRKTSPRSVRTSTVTEILRAQSLDSFEVVKMDIEGMEERVFRDTSRLSQDSRASDRNA